MHIKYILKFRVYARILLLYYRVYECAYKNGEEND
jgi:hypothetical protein